MIKRFLSFTIPVIILTFILFFGHRYVLDKMDEEISISLNAMYLFHFVAYIIICLAVEFLYSKLPSQVGYAYLSSVFIKIGIFVLVFKSTIISSEELSMASRLSIVIPMFIFLVFEATYCGRLMNSQ